MPNKRKGKKHKKGQQNKPKKQRIQIQTPTTHTTAKSNLIPIENETIIVCNAGCKDINGVYEHRHLEQDYFERIASIKVYKHSSKQTTTETKDIETEDIQPQNDDNINTDSPTIPSTKPQQQSQPKSVATPRFEIDFQEYLKNPDNVPHTSINKSGAWILWRTDIHPKVAIYASNCPFKDRIPKNGWISLSNDYLPPPQIKYFTEPKTKQKSNDSNALQMNDESMEIDSREARTTHKKLGKIEAKNQSAKQLTIISGGQTGVDRAALDVAIELGIPYSGWIPKGGKAEDGTIDMLKYKELKESETTNYKTRTLLNVIDSDATLIINIGKLDGGTLLTKQYVSQKDKDLMYITLTFPDNDNQSEQKQEKMSEEQKKYVESLGFLDGRAQRVSEWIRRSKIKVLNVAGPRESKRPGIYQETVKFLRSVLKNFENGRIPSDCLFNSSY